MSTEPLQRSKSPRASLYWAAAFLAVLAVGVLTIVGAMRRQLNVLERTLLHQAYSITQSIPLERVKLLLENPDTQHPAYQRLQHQLDIALQLNPRWRQIKLLTLSDSDDINILLTSRGGSHNDPSRPPPPDRNDFPLARQAFDNVESHAEGPLGLRRETLISRAYVPLGSTYSNRPAIVVVLTVDSSDWYAQSRRAGRPPLQCMLVLLLILAVSHIRWRTRAANSISPPRRSHLEIVTVILTGLTLTVAGGWRAHELETRHLHEIFQVMAHAKASNFLNAFRHLRDTGVESFGQFFENSDHVSREEFDNYCVELDLTPAINAWGWIEQVPTDQRDAWQRAFREQLGPDARIWEYNGDRQAVEAASRPIHYPIVYLRVMGPEDPHFPTTPGFDLASDPALEHLLTHHDPLAFSSDLCELCDTSSERPHVSIFRPVLFADPHPGQPGFVVAILHFQRFFQTVVSAHPAVNPLLNLEISECFADAPPLLLASAAPAPAAPPRANLLANFIQPFTLPILAFGRVYAVTVQPTPLFGGIYKTFLTWLVLLSGLIITAISAWLTATIVNRNAHMTRLVAGRTHDLTVLLDRYNQLSRHTRTITWSVDLDGCLTRVSQTCHEILGHTAEELVGNKSLSPTRHDAPDDIFAQTLRDAMANLRPILNLEHPARTKDGRNLWMTTSGIPLLDARGQLTGYQGNTTDITRDHLRQQEHERLQERLRHAEKMESIGRLAGGIAHDFNNMLQAILGYSELALDTLEPAHNAHHDLREIQQVARRSANLIQQLQAFARKQPIQPRVLELNAVVEDSLGMLAFLLGAHIPLDWQPGTGDLYIQFDPGHLDQVLINLCVNARDAIAPHPGRIYIETARVKLDNLLSNLHGDIPPGIYIRLAITDTGSGMTPDHIARVFEPFYTSKKIGQGLGLGLATVHGILQQNRATPHIISRPGQGTTFEIYFPAQPPPDTLDPAAPPGDPAAATTPPGTETILLVEDADNLRRAVHMMLESLGYTVHAYATPLEALQFAQKNPAAFDCLLTDILMPDLLGTELVQRLLALRPHLPFLYISGYAANQFLGSDPASAQRRFLAKPFSRSQLARKLREILDASH